MTTITCPCCNNTIAQIASVLLDNIKRPLGKECVFCLNELNPLNNAGRLVSCGNCGVLFHSTCWYNYYNYHLTNRNRTNRNRQPAQTAQAAQPAQPVPNALPIPIPIPIIIAPQIYVVPTTR